MRIGIATILSVLGCGASTVSAGDVRLDYISPASLGRMDINDSGQVVGFSWDGTSDRLFRYTDGIGREWIETPPYAYMNAPSINSVGQILYAGSGSGSSDVLLYTEGAGTRVFDDFDTQMVSPGGLNNRGQVAGTAHIPGNVTAFRWSEEAGVIDLGDLGRTNGSVHVSGINEHGQVVGAADLPSWDTHAFRYTDGVGMVDLGTLGGSESVALGINNHGSVFGWSEAADGFFYHFLYTDDGGMENLGLSAHNVEIADINDAGWLVGTSWNLPQPFVWTRQTGYIDLNSLLPEGTDAMLATADAVNERGQIIGHGRIGDDWGIYRLSLDSIPAPGTIPAIVCGVAALAVRRRR